MNVVLFTIPDHESSETAIQLVRENMETGSFAIRVCPSAMADVYFMPFLTLEDNSALHGLESIKYFLHNRTEFQPLAAH